jgi:DNA-binding NarL/FixJ family response regulator
MERPSVVLLQSDHRLLQLLIAGLSRRFQSVREARSVGDLRVAAAKHRPEVLIVDMEVASISDVEHLTREFPGVSIVCNHRLADDALWTKALAAGAADCCASFDTHGILQAALRSAPYAHRMAA